MQSNGPMQASTQTTVVNFTGNATEQKSKSDAALEFKLM